MRTINLDGVKMAGEVAVDNKGYVYVTDTTQNDTARFAVVYDPDWANPTSTNVIYGSLSTNWQTGVAAYDDGAVIVQRNDALNAFGVIGGTSATKIDNNGVKENKGLVSDPPATPAAVAVNRATGDVYIASNLTTLNENFDYVDQAQIAGRSSNWGDLGTVDMVGATILDLAFASDGTNDSLAMVGLINGNLRAWKTTLTNGAQGSQDILSLGSGVVGTSKIAASDDGKMLWVTAQGTGTAYSLDLQSWIQSPSTLSSLRVGDQIFDIATHAYVPMVPEPSSLLSLFALGAGAFGFMRKRR